ncbi:MAG: hypothetical protein GWN62_00175, partial [Aliifodinibius sp.]|nr:hypothetical protein [Fodinibius sp.]
MWSGSPYIFRAIHFVDDQVGWMGGEWNTIMKTNDGGNTWSIQFQDSLDQEGIVSVFALDTMNIFAVSKDGILYHSLDGGANWNGASLYSG